MFRTQFNIPEIYTDKSRDFQLLCHAKDLVFGGVKYNIDSLRHTSNTMEINASLLPLLKSKVGFFDKDTLTEDNLRYLLSGFPFLIRNKGSKKGVEMAINLWRHAEHVPLVGNSIINVRNDDYVIQIILQAQPQDTTLLDHILKYVIPTGYTLQYHFIDHLGQPDVPFLFTTKTNIHDVNPYENSLIKQFPPSEEERCENSVGFSKVIGKLDNIPDIE